MYILYVSAQVYFQLDGFVHSKHLTGLAMH